MLHWLLAQNPSLVHRNTGGSSASLGFTFNERLALIKNFPIIEKLIYARCTLVEAKYYSITLSKSLLSLHLWLFNPRSPLIHNVSKLFSMKCQLSKKKKNCEIFLLSSPYITFFEPFRNISQRTKFCATQLINELISIFFSTTHSVLEQNRDWF